MKKQKFLNTLIALVILAATWGAFTYYDKRKAVEKAPTTAGSQERILPLDAEHIQAISFKWRGGDAFTCSREDGKWTVTDPRKLAVDQGNFSSVLNSLTTATIDQVVDSNPSNLKDFGLDSPAYTLDITTNAKPVTLSLLLGDDTPTAG